MKRKILALLTCVLLSTFIYPQERTYTTVFDSLYSNVKFDTLSTGILYNRVFPWANIERFSNILDTTNAKHFRNSFNELQKSVINKDLQTFSTQSHYLDFYNNDDTNIHIPISIINSNFSIIDTNAFLSGKLFKREEIVFVNEDIQGNIFKNKRLFLSSPLQIYFRTGNTLIFTISNALCFQNVNSDTLVKILIDYDNGEGFKEYLITSDEFNFNERVVYSNYGDKTIKTKGITYRGDTLISFAKIIVHQKTVEKEDVDNLYIVSDIPYIGYEEGAGRKGEAQMRVYYSDETRESQRIKRPILIVDGFDPDDKRQFEKDIVDNPEDDYGGIWGQLKYDSIYENGGSKKVHIGEELLRKGYDIVVLNFPNIPYDTIYPFPFPFQYIKYYDGGADFIERNALVCIKAIDTINYLLKQYGSREQLVIIGPSMGGQITRFALKYMEDSLPSRDYRGHNTRLWVSFDSPHQGANISLGAQAFTLAWAEKKYNVQLNNPAAKEMLLFHRGVHQYKQKPEFHIYYNKINQMGFPSKLRKVAATNGSLNGTKTGEASQKVLMMKTVSFFNWSLVNLGTVYMSPSYPTSSADVFTSWFYDDISQNTSSNQSNCNYDIAPGGTFKTFELIYKGIKEDCSDWGMATRTLYKKEHCFIPTKSALAYNEDITNNANLREDLFQDWNRDLVAEGVIPFDNYWGPINENMQHVTFNKWLHAWFNKELDTYIKGERELSLCNEYKYTINNISQGTNVEWSCSDNLQIISEPNSQVATIIVKRKGNGWIRAKVSSLDHRKDLGYYTVIVKDDDNVIAETQTNGNTLWNTPLNIGSDFTVKSGHILRIENTTISLGARTKIHVEPNARLYIINSKLTNYCNNNYWGGIEVYGHRNNIQSEEYQGCVEINNSIIENARNAVALWKSNDWNSMGGIVKAYNTTFINNLRSAEFMSYKNLGQNNEEINNRSQFINCTFEWNRHMFNHDKIDISHVTLWDVKGVKFVGCDFISRLPKDDNIIKNGIYSLESNVSVSSRDIFDFKQSNFINLTYGIRADNTTKPLSVYKTYFKDNFCGIFLTSNNNAKITKNEFLINPIFNPRGLYEADASYGVVLNGSTGYKIEENKFYSTMGQEIYSVGLQIKNSGTGANRVRNNVFDNLYHATESIGKNRGIDNNSGTILGLKYLCNNFQTSKYAIIIDKDKNNINEYYGPDLYLNGGTLFQSAENIFNRNGLGESNIYVCDLLNIYNYTCFREGDKEPIYKSSNVSIIDADSSADCSKEYDVFDRDVLHSIYRTLENDYITNLYNYNNLLDGGSTDALLDKIQGSWSDEVWEIRQEFISKSPYLSTEVLIELAKSQKLPLPIYLEVALSNPEATQKDEYLDFMKSDEGENILTANGKEMIIDSWNTKTFRATIESNISSKLSNMEEITRELIYRTINDSLGFNLSQYRELLGKIRNIDAKYELVDSYIETKEYNSAIDLLSTLLIYPNNEKYNSDDINDYLSLIDIMKDRNDTTNQLPIDERIEELSKSTTRAGVKARAYLNFINENTNYHPDYITINTKPKSKENRKDNLSSILGADVNLVPNPAKDYISIIYNLPPKEIYTIKIYDNKGIELLTKTLNGNKGIQIIDINKFLAGNYIYTIENNKKIIKKGKLIIAK